jgi:hypothetical protein
MFLDSNTNNITDCRSRTGSLALSDSASAENFNTLSSLYTAVISYIQHGFLLNQCPGPLINNAFFNYLHKPPAFGLADGSAFDNFYDIADTALVTLIMYTKFRPALYVFTVNRMLDCIVYLYANALVAAFTYDYTPFGFDLFL